MKWQFYWCAINIQNVKTRLHINGLVGLAHHKSSGLYIGNKPREFSLLLLLFQALKVSLFATKFKEEELLSNCQDILSCIMILTFVQARWNMYGPFGNLLIASVLRFWRGLIHTLTRTDMISVKQHSRDTGHRWNQREIRGRKREVLASGRVQWKLERGRTHLSLRQSGTQRAWSLIHWEGRWRQKHRRCHPKW